MRERIWLALRQSPPLRRLHAVPVLGRLMTAVSYVFVPTYSQRTVKVQNGPGKGLLLTLNPRWEIGLWKGSYEGPVQAALQSLLGPEKVFYDVGGSIGFYSLLAARFGARAVVFEPDRYNAQCLQRNAEVNGYAAQILIIEMAVYSHTGRLTMEKAEQSTGHGCAHVVTQPTASAAHLDVPCTRLDDFIVDYPVPGVVKIDVEGAESEVLQGAEKLFTQFKPHLICEVHDATNLKFTEQWLERMGYELQWLEPPDSFPAQLLGSPR